MELQGFASITFISKLLGKCLHDVTEAILKSFIHLCEVCLGIEIVLQFFHPICKLISEMIEGIFEIRNSLSKFIEFFLAHSIATSRSLRNSQISKGFLQFQEFFLKSSNSCFQILEVIFLELLKFCSQSLSLKFERFLDIIYLLEKHFLQVFDFFVCVASKLYAK